MGVGRVSLRRSVIAALGAGLFLASSLVFAEDGFRCPATGRLVQVGDSARKVEKRCGRPDEREPVVEDACDQGRCSRRVGERWTYDFGHTYFVRYLLFWNGSLAQIAEGEYGDR